MPAPAPVLNKKRKTTYDPEPWWRVSETIFTKALDYKKLSFILTPAIVNPVEGEFQRLLFRKDIWVQIPLSQKLSG